MNSNSLFSVVQLFLVLALASAGLFFVALPWAPDIRFKAASFLAEQDGFFIPLGAILLAMALALGVGFYFLQKRAYVQLRMNPAAYLEKEVVCSLLKEYWNRRFPQSHLKTDIVFHRDQKIEFIAELPSLDSSVVEDLFAEVEEEMGQLLVHQIGYRKDFIFTLHLQ